MGQASPEPIATHSIRIDPARIAAVHAFEPETLREPISGSLARAAQTA